MNSGGSSLDEGNDWLVALTSVKDNGNNSVTCANTAEFPL